jgi:predicted lipase
MSHGRDPNEVADLVLKIIEKKTSKINYLVGGFLEKKISLKSLLPDKLFQKIIMKLYNL